MKERGNYDKQMEQRIWERKNHFSRVEKNHDGLKREKKNRN